ncbi:hypothetical protein RDI58_016646 [Solanum bulbocastanum]|uniref:Yippee domain-containing protein n=1 Tax=Solanum bulbocastanum TaxID=147425 RepID=A0AAN8TQN1_SOLBU
MVVVQNGRTGVFNSVFNLRFLNNANYLRHVNGNTVADVYCVQCGMALGLKLIVVPRPSQEIREGREKLVYWGDYSMIYQEQDGTVANIDQVLYELSEGGVVHQLVPTCMIASFAVSVKLELHSSRISFLMPHHNEPVNHQGYLERRDGNTLLNIYSVQCRMWLGWRLVRTTQQSEYFVVGRYFMKLELLIHQSGETLRDAVFGVANEQAPNGGATAVQNGVANNGGANAVQNGVANEQAPNGGANAVQNGVTNEQNRGQHRAGILKPRRLRPRWNRPY